MDNQGFEDKETPDLSRRPEVSKGRMQSRLKSVTTSESLSFPPPPFVIASLGCSSYHASLLEEETRLHSNLQLAGGDQRLHRESPDCGQLGNSHHPWSRLPRILCLLSLQVGSVGYREACNNFISWRHIKYDIPIFSCSNKDAECEDSESKVPPRPYWCDSFGFLIIITILGWSGVIYGYVSTKSYLYSHVRRKINVKNVTFQMIKPVLKSKTVVSAFKSVLWVTTITKYSISYKLSNPNYFPRSGFNKFLGSRLDPSFDINNVW